MAHTYIEREDVEPQHYSTSRRKQRSSSMDHIKGGSDHRVRRDPSGDKLRTHSGISVQSTSSEYSSSFFPEATFGDSIFVSQNPNLNEDKLALLERIERILRFAQKRLKKSRVEGFFERKRKKSKNGENGGILHVQHSDLNLDKILGNGSYNVVYSVKSIKGNVLDPDNIVVKTLRSKLLVDLPMLAACAADLRKEGLLLAALQQEPAEDTRPMRRFSNKSQEPIVRHSGADHVVKVLGWAPTGLSAFANGCHDSFFLILERLDRTLTDTIKEWKALEDPVDEHQRQSRRQFKKNLRKAANSSRGLLLASVKNSFFRSDSHKKECNIDLTTNSTDDLDESFISAVSSSCKSSVDPDQVRFWKMRLKLLEDLCGAISFLHSQRVIHRDLKPDNVGFDKMGNLKVFDFDVARVLPTQANWGNNYDETFKMTRKVGSPRYMSPEVARGEYYNEKSDVYALALLAYEILSLKRPFGELSSDDASERLKKGGKHAYKECIEVVVRGEYEEPKQTNGRRQRRRNSFTFGMGGNDHSGKASTDGQSKGKNGGSSGKLSEFADNLFRRRSRSRGTSKKQSRKTAPKYANLRPLLPVATPRELAEQETETHEEAVALAKKRNSQSTPNPRCHHHAVNDITIETTSFFWTQAIRTTIDRAWSYDIATRPFASELKNLISEEVDRIEWNEEDPTQSSSYITNTGY